MSQLPKQHHFSSNSDDNIDTVHELKHNKKRRRHNRPSDMPSPPTPTCTFCTHLSHLNAEFYDLRLDLLDLTYVFFLFFSLFLYLLPHPCFLLPVSFLIYSYLRRGPLCKLPEPPPDMAIVRLAGERVYFRDGSYQEFRDWGKSGRDESEDGRVAEYGRTCLICDDNTGEQREGMHCEGKAKGFRDRWGMVDQIVDLRVPQLGV